MVVSPPPVVPEGEGATPELESVVPPVEPVPVGFAPLVPSGTELVEPSAELVCPPVEAPAWFGEVESVLVELPAGAPSAGSSDSLLHASWISPVNNKTEVHRSVFNPTCLQLRSGCIAPARCHEASSAVNG